MLTESTLFGTVDKVSQAVARIRLHEPEDGYYVAFSGGKDSVVVLDLVRKAGVRHTAHHSLTGVEPPELIYFIREHYPDVITESPEKTMWRLIEEQGVPPTRLMRYCCKELKERGGEGRFKITGIRHEEACGGAKESISSRACATAGRASSIPSSTGRKRTFGNTYGRTISRTASCTTTDGAGLAVCSAPCQRKRKRNGSAPNTRSTRRPTSGLLTE